MKSETKSGKKNCNVWVIILIIVILFFAFVCIVGKMSEYKRHRGDRDMIRRSQSVAVLNAILKYRDDHEGSVPEGIDNDPTTVQVIGEQIGNCAMRCDGVQSLDTCVNLQESIVGDGYLDEIPMDPKDGSTEKSFYFVNKLSNGDIEVGSCMPEDAKGIKVKR